ncbi:hypothetical protein SGLAM104S_01123 [Streptomyces glaucescens]
MRQLGSLRERRGRARATSRSCPGSRASRGCRQTPVVVRRTALRRPVRALGAPAGSPRTGRTRAFVRCGESTCRASRGRRECDDTPLAGARSHPEGTRVASGRVPSGRRRRVSVRLRRAAVRVRPGDDAAGRTGPRDFRPGDRPPGGPSWTSPRVSPCRSSTNTARSSRRTPMTSGEGWATSWTAPTRVPGRPVRTPRRLRRSRGVRNRPAAGRGLHDQRFPGGRRGSRQRAGPPRAASVHVRPDLPPRRGGPAPHRGAGRQPGQVPRPGGRALPVARGRHGRPRDRRTAPAGVGPQPVGVERVRWAARRSGWRYDRPLGGTTVRSASPTKKRRSSGERTSTDWRPLDERLSGDALQDPFEVPHVGGEDLGDRVRVPGDGGRGHDLRYRSRPRWMVSGEVLRRQ